MSSHRALSLLRACYGLILSRLPQGPSIQDGGKFSQILDPYPPTVGSFLVLSVGKFGKFLTAPPLRHADVLKMDVPLRYIKMAP